MRTRPFPPAAAVCLLVAVFPAHADIAVVTSGRDATLYSDATGGTANGSGQRLFAGVTAQGAVRRALLRFDLASIPAGSTITSASITLHMSRSIQVQDAAFTLHRVSRDWGEGASVATDPEGIPAAAAPGDATWLHAFHATQNWTTQGGDFAAASSANLIVGFDVGHYTFASTAALVADVQTWLDSPGGAANFGWLLRGDETAQPTAKRFDSRENQTVEQRPTLTVEYTIPAPAGAPALVAAAMLAAHRRRRRV